MKLELNHITPYLPYGLKGKEFAESEKMYELTMIQTNAKHDFIWNWIENPLASSRIDCKPILRPLSDLDKDIELELDDYIIIGGEKFHEAYDIDFESMNYEKISWFFEHHFDVFDLISKGLAIDINTLD